ncbi:MAG: DnaD domain protein [Lysinibacillus sp.]
MVQMYKELLPNDHFVISIPQPISMNERQLLTLFYQPMTGAQPISLYATLWAEGESGKPTAMTHYYLMNVLGLSIREIFEARVALEAIGLLRTYRASDEENRQFIYELQRPLDAKTFFADPLLSMFLFSKIGEPAYRKLRSRYTQIVDLTGFSDVSRSFTDVFKPVHVRMDVDESEPVQTPKQGYTFYSESFNFDLLVAGLSEQLVPTKMLTAEVREEIAKLAFMYQLSPIEMQKVVIMAFDHNMEFSYERLKKAAADYYKISISKEPPKFEKVHKEPVQQSEHPTTKEQTLITNFEELSPIQSLKAISGKDPLPATVQLIDSLMARLPVGVVNVLLEYVMLTTDMRLPQKYVERIADHWALKKISTAKEAMELARQEHDKYMNWKKGNETKQVQPKKPNYNRRPTGRSEQVPDWFNERNETPKQPEITPEAQQALDFERERQKILEKLGQNGQVK